MSFITIERDGLILAHHTTYHPNSHYGQPVWTVLEGEPEPGPATWRQGNKAFQVDIIEARDGWLIIRQHDGNLCGIIWSDGSYYADLVVDENDKPVTDMNQACHVRGTVPLGGLGSIF